MYLPERRTTSACSRPSTAHFEVTRSGATSDVPVYTTVEPPYARPKASLIAPSAVRNPPPSA